MWLHKGRWSDFKLKGCIYHDRMTVRTLDLWAKSRPAKSRLGVGDPVPRPISSGDENRIEGLNLWSQFDDWLLSQQCWPSVSGTDTGGRLRMHRLEGESRCCHGEWLNLKIQNDRPEVFKLKSRSDSSNGLRCKWPLNNGSQIYGQLMCSKIAVNVWSESVLQQRVSFNSECLRMSSDSTNFVQSTKERQ